MYYIRLVPSQSGDASDFDQRLNDEQFKIVRYVLVNYAELLAEMAAGEGQYLTGLAAMAGAKAKRSDMPALAARLRALHLQHQEPPRFAEAVATSL